MAELCIIEKWAENLDEATVSRWLISEGDQVEAGDALCEIITDKATFEYEAESGGTVKRIYAPPRSTVPVGYVIAFIGGPGEAPAEEIEERNERVMREHMEAAEEEFELELNLGGIGRKERRRERQKRQSRVRGTPAARKLAGDREVTLDEVAEALNITGVVTEDHVREYTGRS